MALVKCLECNDFWINVRYRNYKGLVKCRRCKSVMKVELEEDQPKSCELVRSGQGGSFLYGTP